MHLDPARVVALLSILAAPVLGSRYAPSLLRQRVRVRTRSRSARRLGRLALRRDLRTRSLRRQPGPGTGSEPAPAADDVGPADE